VGTTKAGAPAAANSRLEIPADGRILDFMREGGSKLAHDRPEHEGDRPSAQVLQFPPRDRAGVRPVERLSTGPEVRAREPEASASEPLDDLARYEQDREEEEAINYPQRMLMNAIAVAVVTMLIGVGVWLADTIADMERDQDCVLQGRQNCAPIELPAPIRK
jgi:hypothetical protein